MSDNKDVIRVLSNAKYVAVLQLLNYGLPFITIPYLFRVIGLDNYGLIAYATAVITYFGIIIDYGFGLSATRDIASAKNTLHIEKIYSEVVSAKLYLGIASLLILILLGFFILGVDNHFELYLILLCATFIQSVTPSWLFQGLEKMFIFSFVSLIPKIIYTAFVFLLIKTPEEYYYLPYFSLCANLFGLFFAQYYIKKKLNIKFRLVTLFRVRDLLNKTKYLFLSQVKISLFNNSNVVILGFYSDLKSVALFVAAEKVIRALAMLQSPIVTALYPFSAKKMARSKNETLIVIKKYLKVGGLLYGIVTILTFTFSDEIIRVIYSNSANEASLALKIISIVPFTIYLNNIFGIQIMLNLGMDKYFFRILLFCGILNILICPILSIKLGYLGAAISLAIIESLVAFLMFLKVRCHLHEV